MRAINGAAQAKTIPTAPDASPLNDVESAKSFTATARTVAASGFAIKSAMTVSHQILVHDFVLSHGRSMMATGATAAKTIKANDRKIIEHMRMNDSIHTTRTAMAVTTTAPVGPPVVPLLSETTSQSRPEPASAFWKPNSLMNTT
ncbi:hypothetical protein AS189_18950 [Arthrobacter alpinus]|uniref:Uncharacterized protein n=1 Tax=Arthrobacter alpinus TaxID=656366 RepID=A0A0S2M3N5_9MICC|nr:hypothetical protein [Arthrobacter alpinus]ALO68198.1 hypothetical protein AS189_18950 [Arthrobacter alpinus]